MDGQHGNILTCFSTSTFSNKYLKELYDFVLTHYIWWTSYAFELAHIAKMRFVVHRHKLLHQCWVYDMLGLSSLFSLTAVFEAFREQWVTQSKCTPVSGLRFTAGPIKLCIPPGLMNCYQTCLRKIMTCLSAALSGPLYESNTHSNVSCSSRLGGNIRGTWLSHWRAIKLGSLSARCRYSNACSRLFEAGLLSCSCV